MDPFGVELGFKVPGHRPWEVELTRILDYNGNEADRTTTVAEIVALKATGRKFTQVTVGTAEEAAAAEEAGIEMTICLASEVVAVRRGSQRCFLTAAIVYGGEVTPDDLLGTALTALGNGADAVITSRRLEVVELLASEGIPVMGHLGFVPKKSTLLGGVRTVDKTSDEAVSLWQEFRRLEDAGAFAVECELIAANVMAEINRRTGLATISLGSGPQADVVFLFMNDICGESERVPRHARQYGNLNALHQQVHDARVAALLAFHNDVSAAEFPAKAEMSVAQDDELHRIIEALDS